MRILSASLIALLLSVCPSEAQVSKQVMWELSPTPGVTYKIYRDGVFQGSASAPPFTITLTADRQVVGVSAVNATGESTATVFTYVAPDAPPPSPQPGLPVISLTAPQSGPVTAPVTISATTSVPLVYMAFAANGNYIGADTAAPYVVSWSPAPGTYQLTAYGRLPDGSDTLSSAPVEVTVGSIAPPPSPPPPVPAWTCTVPATPTKYANGDLKYTFRCPPATPYRKGATVKVSAP